MMWAILHCGASYLQPQNFTKQGEPDAARCNTKAKLKENHCKETDIISPENTYKPIKQKPLTKATGTADPVQVYPQEVKLDLRPGTFLPLLLLFTLGTVRFHFEGQGYLCAAEF